MPENEDFCLSFELFALVSDFLSFGVLEFFSGVHKQKACVTEYAIRKDRHNDIGKNCISLQPNFKDILYFFLITIRCPFCPSFYIVIENYISYFTDILEDCLSDVLDDAPLVYRTLFVEELQ